MSELVGKYASFQTALKNTISSQEKKLKEIGDEYKDKENKISSLALDLKKRSVDVNELHREIDKENAININKLTEIITTLI